jgi:hypothetical protein
MKIGLLADTHSAKNDGSDLPDAVLEAFKGVDLIVHLGDVGKKAILGRLGDVAPSRGPRSSSSDPVLVALARRMRARSQPKRCQESERDSQAVWPSRTQG